MDVELATLPPLDDLDAEGLDRLPVGIIQVDRAGVIVVYNRTEAAFSGRRPEAVIGRDFFRDVARCTHLPAFHGRFLDGLRRGRLDERFRFTFGFEPSPVRVEVSIFPARQPDRFWIVIQPLERLAVSGHRAAAQAVTAVERRRRAEPIDPSVCEREPIHIPGAVQPHAVMIACDPATFVVEACSDNVADAVAGLEPARVMGRSLDEIVPGALPRRLRAALAGDGLADPARPLRFTARLGSDGVKFAVAAHLHDGRLVVELERTAEHPEDFEAATPLQAQDAIAGLRDAGTLEDAAQVAAREIRAMSGFERVLVYRFDAEWNGESVAEDKAADWVQSLLWLRFPASDIPAQARALYARSPSRFVADRDAVPSALMAEPPAANQAVDLTFAQSRALSPVHLEYQRNLGVNGSMSISIMVDGRLWGLVIGHHRKPHYVTPETRALAAIVTDAFGLRVHELDSVRLWREQQATLAAQNRLMERMAGSDDFVSALTEGPDGTLLGLFEAGGAAVVSGTRVEMVGRVPAVEFILALTQWLRGSLPAGRRVFATDHLSTHYGPADGLAVVASGVLAAFIGDGERGREHALLWFRPEVASTVVWGGDPSKPVLADASTRTVLPRRSFERWVEERRGQAQPWEDWQLGTVEALAAAIEGVVLRQGRRIAELTAQQGALTRALEQKDVLAREIDHRVRNSLQIVASVMLMQGRAVADPQAKAAFEDTYARVMSVARVHESLHQSDDAESVDLGQTLSQLCDDLAAGIMGSKQRLDVSAEPGLIVPSKAAVALSLIATELVTNALKYAYDPDQEGGVEVSIKARAPNGVELRVCDAGRGLPADWSDQRPGRAGGLGMRVIRAMLQQIGAEMTISADRPGTCFTVLA